MSTTAYACPHVRAAAADSVTTRPALERFCADVRARALRLALLETSGNHHAAADLVQDSLERLVSRYADKPEAQWAPLFYGILRNRLVDWHRRRKVEKVIDFFFTTNADGESDDAVPGWQSLADEAAGPEEQVGSLQLAGRIADAVARLSSRQRQVFLLREMEEMTIADTARAMDISEGSVKTHHLRALTRLRQWLQDDNPGAGREHHAS